VMLGAILSSFNSALNSACTLFSLGFYRHLWPTSTEKQVVLSGVWFGIVVAAASAIIAPYFGRSENIFSTLQTLNGIYAIPILAVVLVAMVSRRVPPVAASCGLAGGLVVLFLGSFVSPFKEVAATVSGFYFLGTVFAWLVILMLVYGELRPSEKEWEQKDVGAVDMTPWRHAGKAGLALIFIVILVYVLFAKF
ncbi:MAG: solute:sodium symporter family transporter, partial [Planctomycetales bacterium]|nr:solute:sodium symporter family transporter [Planctomycetales bacterium]